MNSNRKESKTMNASAKDLELESNERQTKMPDVADQSKPASAADIKAIDAFASYGVATDAPKRRRSNQLDWKNLEQKKKELEKEKEDTKNASETETTLLIGQPPGTLDSPVLEFEESCDDGSSGSNPSTRHCCCCRRRK